MRKTAVSVRDLAREAGLDIEDTLIRLWEAGFDDFLEPTDVVPRASQPGVYDALDIVNPGCPRSIEAWSVRLGISEGELRKQLIEMGVNVTPGMRNLPRGSVAKVKQMLTSMHKPPVTHTESSTRANELSSVKADQVAFEWRTVGRPRSWTAISAEEVLQIHNYLVEQFRQTDDPIEPPGVREEGLLVGAVQRPLTAIGDVLKYPTTEMAAAALLHSLTLNHAFYNGNKRTALVSTLVFLDRNDEALTATEPDVLRQILRLARHALAKPGPYLSDREVHELSKWILTNVRPFTHGDRFLQFRVLRRILSGFGCKFSYPTRGNRINITRLVEERGMFGITRRRTLESQIYYKNEGMDVPRNTINKVRTDLQLDEEHGCDSSAFYYRGVEVIDQVVANYQTTLKRLAKL